MAKKKVAKRKSPRHVADARSRSGSQSGDPSRPEAGRESGATSGIAFGASRAELAVWMQRATAFFFAVMIVWAFLVPVDAASVFFGQALPQQLFWLFTACLAGASAWLGTGFRFRVFDWAGVALCLVGLLLVTWIAGVEANPRRSWHGFWQIAAIAACYFSGRSLAFGPRGRAALIGVVLTGCCASAIHGVYQVGVTFPDLREQYRQDPDSVIAGVPGLDAPEGSPQRQRFEDRVVNSFEPYSHFALANSLAVVLSAGVFLSGAVLVYLGFQREAWTRRRWAVVATTLVFGVVFIAWFLTKSRTAWLAVMAGVIVAGFFLWARRHQISARRFSMFAAVGVLVLGTAGFWLVQNDSLVITEAKKSLGYRLEYWQSTLKMIRDHAVTGVGLGNFQSYYPYYKLAVASEEVADPHNVLLDIAATLGVPLLLLLLAWCSRVVLTSLPKYPGSPPSDLTSSEVGKVQSGNHKHESHASNKHSLSNDSLNKDLPNEDVTNEASTTNNSRGSGATGSNPNDDTSSGVVVGESGLGHMSDLRERWVQADERCGRAIDAGLVLGGATALGLLAMLMNFSGTETLLCWIPATVLVFAMRPALVEFTGEDFLDGHRSMITLSAVVMLLCLMASGSWQASGIAMPMMVLLVAGRFTHIASRTTTDIRVVLLPALGLVVFLFQSWLPTTKAWSLTQQAQFAASPREQFSLTSEAAEQDPLDTELQSWVAQALVLEALNASRSSFVPQADRAVEALDGWLQCDKVGFTNWLQAGRQVFALGARAEQLGKDEFVESLDSRAQRYFEKAVERYPNSVELQVQAAAAAFRLQDWTRFEHWLESAIKLSEETPHEDKKLGRHRVASVGDQMVAFPFAGFRDTVEGLPRGAETVPAELLIDWMRRTQTEQNP